MLPNSDERSGTVLTVVEEDNHAIGVHGLASQELVVLEVGDDLLGESLSTLLKRLDLVRVVLLEVCLDLLHVACAKSVVLEVAWVGLCTLEVSEVALLIKVGLVQAERVDNIDDGGLRILGTLLSLLGGRIGASV